MPQIYQDMTMMNIHEAKTHLSKIIEEVSTLGKPIVIAKAGQPKVKIVPVEDVPQMKRKMGTLKHSIKIPENFDSAYRDEITQLFSGEIS
ncbi:MAG: type II toxin-antitoxin system prevent-host-death family antitoxin [Acinetobacter sp.]|nr:type II toxin-antitoxin system prevent-host-death family antitoxin [Acinetobacter sp.]